MSKLKSNSLTNPMRPYLVRLTLNVFGFGILSFLLAVLLLTLFDTGSDALINGCQSIASLLGMLLYIASTYGLCWAYGFRDINVVKMGYLPDMPLKGLKVGLLAMIPSAALTLAMWVLHFMLPDFPAGTYYELYHFQFKWFYILTDSNMLLYLLPFIVTPLIAHWGFFNGKQNISILRRIVYMNTDKQPKKTDKRLR